MAEYEIKARLEFNVTVTIEAEDESEAQEKFEAAEFDYNLNAAEMVNWSAQGKPKEV